VPSLASSAHDLAIIPKLDAFAAVHIPADARGDVVKAKAAIRFYARIRSDRLPALDRWLAQQK
jgi:puromycin-sensitive aminopeptidase